MAALTDQQQAYVYALEALRKQLQDNALGVAANTQATEDDYKARAKAIGDFMDGKEARPTDLSGGPRAAASSDGIREQEKNPNQRALKEFREDPARMEANAAKQLAAAKKGEQREALGKVPGFNAISSALSELAGKFAAIIGPSAILSAVLNSTVSGFGVLQTSVKVFASTLAPILLPATLMLSSVFLSMADIVDEHGDLMDKVTEGMMQFVPVIEIVIQWLSEAADHIEEMVQAAEDFADWVRRHTPGGLIDAAANDLGLGDEEGGGSLAATDGAKDATAKGMRDALQSLRNSLGPRSTTTGLGSVGAAVQSAAFNSDPLEARLLKQQLEALNRIEGKLPGRRSGGQVYDPAETGAGRYSSGSASGGDYGGGDAASGGDYGGGA